MKTFLPSWDSQDSVRLVPVCDACHVPIVTGNPKTARKFDVDEMFKETLSTAQASQIKGQKN